MLFFVEAKESYVKGKNSMSRRNESVAGLALLVPDRGRAKLAAWLASGGKPPNRWGIKPAE